MLVLSNDGIDVLVEKLADVLDPRRHLFIDDINAMLAKKIARPRDDEFVVVRQDPDIPHLKGVFGIPAKDSRNIEFRLQASFFQIVPKTDKDG